MGSNMSGYKKGSMFVLVPARIETLTKKLTQKYFKDIVAYFNDLKFNDLIKPLYTQLSELSVLQVVDTRYKKARSPVAIKDLQKSS